MTSYIGEIFALLTAGAWAGVSIFFTLAGERWGSQIVNRVRIVAATLILMGLHWLMRGTPVPLDASLDRWGWLTASGLVGLAFGDACLYYAFTVIGARRGMLLMTLVPVISTLLAWIFLGEILRPIQITAILITVAGIAWVVAEQNDEQPEIPLAKAQRRKDKLQRIPDFPEKIGGQNRDCELPKENKKDLCAFAPLREINSPKHKHIFLGILAGIGAAVGQAGGLVLSKPGMAGDFPAVSASLMRLIAATVIVWAFTALQGEVRPALHALRDHVGLRHVIIGSAIGPGIGMMFSLIAAQASALGIASTLMALSPVLLLPLSHWIFKEAITWRAVLGTLITMIGVGMIFLT